MSIPLGLQKLIEQKAYEYCTEHAVKPDGSTMVGYLDGAEQIAQVILKDVEEVVSALKSVLPHYAPKNLGYIQAHSTYERAEDALKAWAEKYGEK